jgi:L-alanine-DL-glutamate epimerase-like enolase superfamily enzyme
VGEEAVARELRFRRVRRPLRTPFATALGRKEHLLSVLVRVELYDGASGLGEVPTSIAFGEENIAIIGRVLAEARRRLRGLPYDAWAGPIVELRRDFPLATMTASGVEAALFRAALARKGETEHHYWGGRLSRIETDITLPFLPDTAVLEAWTDYAARKGFTTYKMKVSGDRRRDLGILTLVYRLLGERVPGFRIRLDGNQGYSPRTFLALLDGMEKRGYEIELFEQPLEKHDFHGLAYVRERCPVPVILDETVLTAADAQRVVDHGLGDGINIKVAKSGHAESGRLVELARRHNLKLMAGCMIETMAGLSAAVHMAAGTGSFDYVDLDSVHFLHGANDWPGIRREGPAFIIDEWENKGS